MFHSGIMPPLERDATVTLRDGGVTQRDNGITHVCGAKRRVKGYFRLTHAIKASYLL